MTASLLQVEAKACQRLQRELKQLREESAAYEASRASWPGPARTASPGGTKATPRASPRDRAEDLARVKARAVCFRLG